MKIVKVEADNRRRTFNVTTRSGAMEFPYAKADPRPSAKDRLVEVYVDSELGREAFSYRLESGAEGSVHVDSVLDFNEDPAYMADLALYELTQRTKEQFEQSGISVRTAARRLKTSVPQVYRLLDATNYNKSTRQLLSLLYLSGGEVAMKVSDRRPRRAS